MLEHETGVPLISMGPISPVRLIKPIGPILAQQRPQLDATGDEDKSREDRCQIFGWAPLASSDINYFCRGLF